MFRARRLDGRDERAAAVKRELIALIHKANRSEFEFTKAFTSSALVPTAKVSDEVIEGRIRVQEAIEVVLNSGVSLATVESELVDPVIEDGVVGSLAWTSIREALKRTAMNRDRNRANGVPTK